MAGRILAGRYELIEKIGEGGMAVVFKARDRLLNRQVAIKILRPEYTKDAVFVESFRKESQAAAGLVHPNIVNVYDVGREGNIHYIVMELIDGEPLSEIIKEGGKLDPYRATSIAKQVAGALATAHKHQLIHRDVKPHNIMITREGVAKITDFGIAKAVTTDTLVGETKEAVMGSVHYFSPEQARGGYVDERSDIYSLGIVLYEMLTGEVPFDGDSAVEVAVKQINEDLPLPTSIDPDIPKDLEDIILKATQKLQTNRYKSAEEMITALNFVKFSSKRPMVESAEAVAASNAARGIVDEPEEEPDKDNEGDPKGRKNRNSSGRRYRIPVGVQRLIAFALAVLLALPLSNVVFKMVYGDKSSAGQQNEPGQTEPVNPAGILIPDNKATVKVPDISGKSVEEAEKILKEQGLSLSVDLELPSDDLAAGMIMSQNPEAGNEVKEGYTVKVNVSKGKVDGKVPNVLGKTQSSAEAMIKSYGYKVGGGGSTFSDVIPKGCVVSQSPEAGASLADGGTVAIIISAGPENPQLGEINVVGMTLEEATKFIEDKGLTVGGVTYTENAYVQENTIISQDPEPSHEFTEGESVNLVVSQSSQGGTDAVEKKSVQILIDYTAAEEEVFYLTVHVHDSVNGTSVAYQQVEKSRDMGAEFITVSGNGEDGTVVVMFNNKTVYQYSVDFDHGQYY